MLCHFHSNFFWKYIETIPKNLTIYLTFFIQFIKFMPFVALLVFFFFLLSIIKIYRECTPLFIGNWLILIPCFKFSMKYSHIVIKICIFDIGFWFKYRKAFIICLPGHLSSFWISWPGTHLKGHPLTGSTFLKR